MVHEGATEADSQKEKLPVCSLCNEREVSHAVELICDVCRNEERERRRS